jgi:autotransporter passenger strand-loop-strand repeat protein
MFVLSGGVANVTTVSSGGFLTINKGGSGSSSQLFGGTETVSGTEIGGFIGSGGSQRVAALGKAISTTVNNSGTLAVLSGGTASAATVNNATMLVAGGGVVVGATINTSAVVSNAGIIKASSSLSAVIGGAVTNANTIEALGSGAFVKIAPSWRAAAERLSNSMAGRFRVAANPIGRSDRRQLRCAQRRDDCIGLDR